jgi:hypothetical protein
MRILNLIFECINSEGDLVLSVTRHVLLVPSEKSVMYNNCVPFCNFFTISPYITDVGFELSYHTSVKRCTEWTLFANASDNRIALAYYSK